MREFLAMKYDPATMPRLILADTEDGRQVLVGWESKEGEPGLLEAARGWALERAWDNFLANGKMRAASLRPSQGHEAQAGPEEGGAPGPRLFA